MSSMTHEPAAGIGRNGHGHEWGGIPARIVLQPIAAPSVLGLFGFAGATFMVSTNLARWYGDPHTSGTFLFPFAAVFGGIAQVAAGMFSFRARDVLASAMHGTWGSFWIAYGILWFLAVNHTVTPPAGSTFVPLGYWFIVLSAVTLTGTLAAAFESGALVSVLGTLTAGSILLAISYLIGSSTLLAWGGWVLFVSSVLAWYTASAMMLAGTAGRTILPLFSLEKARNQIGARPIVPVEFHDGEPGIRKGQ